MNVADSGPLPVIGSPPPESPSPAPALLAPAPAAGLPAQLPGIVGAPVPGGDAAPVQDPAPRPRSARPVRPAVQGLLALAAYLLVFITGYALPVASHLGQSQLRQYWTDPNFYTWAMRWWPYAVSHGINPLYSDQIGAPGGYNVAWATTTPSVGLLFWPVTAVFGVVASFNLMLLVVPPLSALAAFVLARRLTGRFWASLLAGAVYGLTPFELVHDWQGQPNLTVIALLPLLVYLAVRWWDGTLSRAWFVAWAAVLMALEFYTFTEAFADMTMVLVVALVAGYAVAGRAGRPRVARLAGLTAAGFAGAVLLASPYLLYALHNYPTVLSRQTSSYSLHVVRLVLPWSDKVFGLGPLADYSYRLGRAGLDDYTGLPLLLIPFALAFSARSSRVARLLVIAFIGVIALALGPSLVIGNTGAVPLPWGGLWSLPLARSAEPSRLIIFGYLVMALALALWLAVPAAGWRRAVRWCVALLAAVVLFADLPTSTGALNPHPVGFPLPATMRPANQLPPFITDGLYRHYLRPGETVAVVTERGNAGLLFQAAAGFYFRIVGGFINASLTPRQDAMPAPIGNLRHPFGPRLGQFESYLRTSGIGAILVERSWSEPWMGIFGRLGMVGVTAGGVTVYPVIGGSSACEARPPFRVCAGSAFSSADLTNLPGGPVGLPAPAPAAAFAASAASAAPSGSSPTSSLPLVNMPENADRKALTRPESGLTLSETNAAAPSGIGSQKLTIRQPSTPRVATLRVTPKLTSSSGVIESTTPRPPGVSGSAPATLAMP